MLVIEVNEIRDMVKAVTPRADFESSFTFYYDETNNIRKFYVKENDFNYAFSSNFVLGGVVLEGDAPDLKQMFEGLNLQKSVKEVKFKHVANGNFLDCLTSNKLSYFLDYLLANNIFIHFSSVNILYYSIVDIVDSAIVSSEAAMELDHSFSLHLKNDLYKLAKIEIDSVVELFYRFEYPNIKKERLTSFIESLSSLFDRYLQTNEFHFGLESLRQILKEAKKKGSLPFIMDEEDFILLKDFSQFYMRPIYIFKNSTHIFDNEVSIAEILDNVQFKDGANLLKTYTFEDSKNSQLLQVSDVIVGLIGKLTNFFNTHSQDEIFQCMNSLTDMQANNIDMLLKLILKSNEKNVGFLHSIDSFEELSKMSLICDIRKI